MSSIRCKQPLIGFAVGIHSDRHFLATAQSCAPLVLASLKCNCGYALLRALFVASLFLVATSLHGQWDELNFRKGTFFGGPNNVGNIGGLAQDSSGYVYGLGVGTDYPTTPGAFQTQRNGAADIVVFKLSSDLKTLIWCSYLGGSTGILNGKYDYATDIAVSPQGEVVVVGYTINSDFPITSGPNYCSTVAADTVGIFVTKFNSSGSNLVFSRIIGYSGDAPHPRMCLNAQGEILVCATITANPTLPPLPPWDVSANAYQSAFSAGSDMAFAKLSPSGSTIYGSYLGSSNNRDKVFDLCYGKSKLYLSGVSYSLSSSSQANFPLLQPGEEGFIVVEVIDNGSTMTVQKCLRYHSSSGPTIRGMAYDPSLDQVNLMSYNVSIPTLYVLDSGINQVVFSKPFAVTQNFADIVIGNHGRKYITSNMSIFETDSTGLITLWSGSISGVQNSSYGCRALIRPGNECNYTVLFGSTTNSTTFKTTRDVYQPSRLGIGATPGITMLGKAQSDTVRMTILPSCGAVLFKYSGAPCPYTTVTWDFNDGNQVTVATDTISHVFKRSGLYQIRAKVAFPDRDSVVHDTTLYVTTTASIQCTPRTIYRCANDTNALTLNVSGASRYIWHPGNLLSDSTIANPIAHPKANMKYYVRGYDANGCFADDSIQVYVTQIKANINLRDTTVCAGNSVQLVASGGSEYKWLPAAGLSSTKTAKVVATPSASTEYSVVVSDGGCSDTAKVRILLAHAPKLVLSESPIVCTGGSATLSVRAVSADSVDTLGMKYDWSPAQTLTNSKTATPSAAPLVSTTYRCSATNAFGCVVVDSVRVRVQSSLDLQLSSDTLTCAGSSLYLKASGGAQYSWSPAEGLDDSTLATPLCTAQRDISYRVMTWSGAFATASCRDTAIMQVHVYAKPQVHASGGSTVCRGTSVTLSSTLDSVNSLAPGFERVWHTSAGMEVAKGASTVVSPDSTTTYIVSAFNSQGCSSSDTVRVVVSNALSVKAVGPTAVASGTIVHLSVAQVLAGTDYYWLDANRKIIGHSDTVSLSLSTSSWFYVHAVHGGCEGWDSIFVDIQLIESVHASADTSLCQGQMLVLRVLNVQAQTSYSWTSDQAGWTANGDSVIVVADQTQHYYVLAQQGSIVSRDTMLLSVFALPRVSLRDTSICELKTLELAAQDTDSSDTFIWRDSTNTVLSKARTLSLRAERSARYTVEARNTHGCTSIAQMQVFVEPQQRLEFSLAPMDSVYPAGNIYIKAFVRSAYDVSNQHIRAELRIPKDMVWYVGGRYDGTDLVLDIDTTMDLRSTARSLLAERTLSALINQTHSINVRLTNIQTDFDKECLSISSDQQTLGIRGVCGNSYLRVEYRETVLQISPNPSTQSVEVRSSEAIRLYDALGHEVDLSSAEHVVQDNIHVWTINTLPSGMYYVRTAGARESVAKALVVIQ